MDRLSMVNDLFVMRHGTSLANAAGIILSSPGDGVEGWGLAPGAEEEVRRAVRAARLPGGVLVCCSDFLRARQTARIAAAELGADDPRILIGLRERFFGFFDHQDDAGYRDVWIRDRANPDNRHAGVESPLEVLHRMVRAVEAIDALREGRPALLVSHGDPLHILLAHAAGLPPQRHREIVPMKPAEIRALAAP